MPDMIQVNLCCPLCGHSLMDESHKIDGLPSIAIDVVGDAKPGKLYMSSLYGSYNLELDVSCPTGGVAQMRCPHCAKDLRGTRTCDLCDAPMVRFAFQEAGTIQVCSRRGCKKHLMEFEDPAIELRAFYETYSEFFAPET